MSMTLQQMRDNIADITENTFTDAQLDLFISKAEQAIYTAINLPSGTFTETSASLSIGDPLKSMPSGYLSTVSLATKDANNVITYLIEKDNSFLLEAYPDQDTTGDPVYYAQYGESGIGGSAESMFIAVAPTPSNALSLIHTYKAYPASLTAGATSGTTWLSSNFDSVLLNGALVEAGVFMKAEADIQAMYDKQYMTSLKLLDLYRGKVNKDAYRVASAPAPVGAA